MMSCERTWSRCLTGSLLLGLLLPGVAPANDLLDLYRSAQTRDSKFLSARAQRDVLLEQRPQAISQLLPQLSLQASYDWNHLHEFDSANSATITDPDTGLPVSTGTTGVDDYGDTTYGLTLQQTLFDWQQFHALEQADAIVAQAQATYRAAEQDLVYRVADAYFTALNAEDTYDADQEAHAAYAQQLEAARKKFDIGLATITDVRNAQASFDGSEATLIVDRRAADSARRALAEITGGTMAPTQRLREEIPLETPNPASQDAWARASRDHNPALKSFEHAAEAAQKSLEALGGGYYPRLSMVGSTARSNSDYRFGADRLIDSIGVQARWDLFSGGLTASRIREAQATLERSQFDLEGTRRSVDRLTRDAYEGVISGIASVNATRQSVRSYQTSVDSSEIGLKVGARTQADVLNAQRDLANARRVFFNARYDYLRNALLLRQQAGSLGQEDLARIDTLLIAPDQARGPAPPRPPELALPSLPPPVSTAPAPLVPPSMGSEDSDVSAASANDPLARAPSSDSVVAGLPPPPLFLPNVPRVAPGTGVRTIPLATAEAPRPAATPTDTTARKKGDGTLALQFPAMRVRLSPDQISWLDTQAPALKAMLDADPQSRLIIVGSADRGSDGHDAGALAARRAAVAAEVLSGDGIPVDRMTIDAKAGSLGSGKEAARVEIHVGKPPTP